MVASVSLLKPHVSNNLDLLQFVYKQGRGTEDAVNSLMQLILKGLGLGNHRAYAGLYFLSILALLLIQINLTC